MPLFDDIERINTAVPRAGESRFSYLNASARPAAAEVREFLTRSVALYPEAGRSDLIARLRSIDTTFDSAVFELIIYQLLVRSGHEILAIEPAIPGTAKRPDFLVAAPDGTELIVECVVANGRSEQAIAADRRLSAALEVIAETASPQHLLSVHIEGAAQAVITTRRLRRVLAAWIESLPAGPAGAEAEPFIYEEHGLTLNVSVSVERQRPSEVGDRSVAAIHYPIRAAQPGEDLRGSLNKKARRYGDLGKPYIIAVGDVGAFNGERHLMDALLGSPAIAFNPNVAGGEPRQVRAQDGVWTNGRRPRKRGVSGVLYLAGADAWRPWGRSIRFVTNPWAAYPLDESSLTVPKLLPHDGEFRKIEGEEGPGLLGLAKDWPVD
jgi:hypothetical protein